MEKKQHIFYFDYLRIIAMTGVIFMHAAAGPLRGQVNTSWNFLNIVTSLSFSAVPLFFMMSGYFSLSADTESDGFIPKLLRRRLPRLIIPLIGWSIVAILWQMYAENSFTVPTLIYKLKYSLHDPIAVHLWYMYTLIAFYVISPVLGGIRRLGTKGRIFIFCVIAACSLYISGSALLTLFGRKMVALDLFSKLIAWTAEGHLLTFILGYILGTTKKRIPNAVLIISAVAAAAIITVSTYILTVRGGAYDQTFQRQSCGFEVILAALIFMIFKQNLNREPKLLKGSLKALVSLSLPVYMMHNILLSMFFKAGISPSDFTETCGVTVLLLVICILVLMSVATVKPICYIATGMSFEAACRSCNWIYVYRMISQRKIKY